MSSIVLNPSGAPASPSEGEVYYDSTADKLKVRDSSAFREVVTQDATFNGTIGTSATVPASVGSSFALVKSAQGFTCTNSDTLASAYIENCFNSTYRDYRIIITGTTGSAYQAYFRMRLGNSSTARNSTTGYYWTVKGYDSAGNARQVTSQGASYFSLLNDAKATGNFDRFVIDMVMHNPQGSGGTAITGTSSHPRAGAAYITNYIGGYFDEDFQATNMQFYFNTGSENRTLNIQSYGIKTA